MNFQTHAHEWNDELLQRLVDHELSEDEERSFLAMAEATGEWRTVALALLEDRLMGRVLRSQAVGTRTFEAVELIPIEQNMLRTVSPTSSLSMGGRRMRRQKLARKTWRQVSLVAALMLVSFGGGWFSSNSLMGDSPVQLAGKVKSSLPGIDNAGRGTVPIGRTEPPLPGTMQMAARQTLADASLRDQVAFQPAEDAANEVMELVTDEVQVMFADGDGMTRPMVVRVIEATDLEQLEAFDAQQLESQEELKHKLQLALAPHRRDVVQRDQWVEVSLADGRRGMMPVRDLMVVSQDPQE
ncbi:MAG: hypothetical protein C0478_03545 [Planctomyces sp.]|nr:hypothetical protein [Planctomyces sp.]